TGVALLCGAAALVRSAYPGLSATQVADHLRAAATDRGTPGPDSQFGSGVLNLRAALTAPAASPSPVPSPSRSAQPAARSAEIPLADSRDWRRWLVILPLAAFVAGLIGYALRRPTVL
ncbi:MAG: hypothetical protein HOV79_21615, partial [Hamadaea sp.]|nr:hypothetical protein [Hamadaea sp.]